MWNYKNPEKRISTLCTAAVARAHSKLLLCIRSIWLPQNRKQRKKTRSVFSPRYVERKREREREQKEESQTSVTRATGRAELTSFLFYIFLTLQRSHCLQIFGKNSIIKLFLALEGWKDAFFPGSSLNLFLKHIKILLGWSSFFTALFLSHYPEMKYISELPIWWAAEWKISIRHRLVLTSALPQ